LPFLFLGNSHTRRKTVSFSTQISGKYSPDNSELFAFKRLLKEAGLSVSFPVGDTIIEYEEEFAITVPQERRVPFHLTEEEFYRRIEENHLQIVYNLYGTVEGYVGESTLVETAYALICNKPIILLRDPFYGDRTSRSLAEIVEANKSKIFVRALDKLTIAELQTYINEVMRQPTNYSLPGEMVSVIRYEMIILTEKYRKAWERYTSNHGSR
jgi:hypothetical protein